MKRIDFENGNIVSNILKAALPMLVAQIMSLLYNIVDRVYIARIPDVGTTALGAVGLCFPIIVIITAFSNLFGTGGAPIFSIERGKGNHEKAGLLMNTSFTLLTLCAVILMIIGLLFARPILVLFGASDAGLAYAYPYLMIYLLGTFPSMAATGMNPFINAQGYATTGMTSVIIGAVANLLLDPLFIFVFGMGVRGAAIATVISQTVSAVWVIAFLLGNKNLIRVRKQFLRLQRDVSMRIMGLGVSTFIMNLTEAAISAVFNASLSRFGGDIYVTVMTVATSVSQLVFMPLSGFAQGAQPVTGYNYGAREYTRVKQCFWFLVKASVTYAVLAWLVLMIFPRQLIGIFNNDPTLMETAIPMFRVFFCMNFIMSLQMSAQNTFVAMGEAKKATFFALYRKVLLLIPLILILPRIGFGITGVFAAEPVADTISALTCFTTFLLTAYRKLGRMEQV